MWGCNSMTCSIGFLENLDGSLKISLNSSANSGGRLSVVSVVTAEIDAQGSSVILEFSRRESQVACKTV